jgi:hypothetical protein
MNDWNEELILLFGGVDGFFVAKLGVVRKGYAQVKKSVILASQFLELRDQNFGVYFGRVKGNFPFASH